MWTSATFQSSRPLRGATGGQGLGGVGLAPISILAPLAGRDCPAAGSRPGPQHFNPRAPCGARRGPGPQRLLGRQISILAPLAGRDGRPGRRCTSSSWNFNPRAPCGARRAAAWGALLPRLRISILAPLAGRDSISRMELLGAMRFQSSRPLRGATSGVRAAPEPSRISILAPLAGRDHSRPPAPGGELVISILAPLAGRDFGNVRCAVDGNEFQSSRPLRGATI